MTDELLLKKLETLDSSFCADHTTLMSLYRNSRKADVRKEIESAMSELWNVRLSVVRAIHHHNNRESK